MFDHMFDHMFEHCRPRSLPSWAAVVLLDSQTWTRPEWNSVKLWHGANILWDGLTRWPNDFYRDFQYVGSSFNKHIKNGNSLQKYLIILITISRSHRLSHHGEVWAQELISQGRWIRWIASLETFLGKGSGTVKICQDAEICSDSMGFCVMILQYFTDFTYIRP